MITRGVAPNGAMDVPYRTVAALGFAVVASVVWFTESVGHSRVIAPLDGATWYHGWSLWLSASSYGLYALPFVLRSPRPRRDIVWRLLIGFTFQIMIVLAYLALASRWLPQPPIVPCLQVAASFLILFTLFWAGAAGIVALLLSIPIAVLVVLADEHRWWDVPVSILLGWSAYQLAKSPQLTFLALPHPTLAIRRHFRNLANLVTTNTPEAWDRMYREAYWDFLRDPHQRPRHYLIAGIVTDHQPNGPAVLDVGCGQGVLLSVLNHARVSYVGIDLSAAAIAECRRVFVASPHASFEALSFQEFHTSRKFDAVIFNEVLYYGALRSLRGTIRKARQLLKEGGIIVVSMNRNLKTRAVWRVLDDSLEVDRRVRVENTLTGSSWTVASYRSGAIPRRVPEVVAPIIFWRSDPRSQSSS